VPLILDSIPSGRGRRSSEAYSGDNADDLASAIAHAPAVWLTVRWQSALPVTQALMSYADGEDANVQASSRKPLKPDASHYWLAVTGIPTIADSYGPGRYERALMADSQLSFTSGESMRPSDVYVEPVGISFDLFFQFPRTRDLTANDGDVEFSMPLGKSRLKQKFHLKDMLYQSKLAL
jgi:hypothetical protein